MGGEDVHEFPAGYGHPIQCDTMEDVKAKNRMEFVYDESAAVARMEREKKTLEKHSKKYKYHKDQAAKTDRQMNALKQKIERILEETVDYSWAEFQFLVDIVEVERE